MCMCMLEILYCEIYAMCCIDRTKGSNDIDWTGGSNSYGGHGNSRGRYNNRGGCSSGRGYNNRGRGCGRGRGYHNNVCYITFPPWYQTSQWNPPPSPFPTATPQQPDLLGPRPTYR